MEWSSWARPRENAKQRLSFPCGRLRSLPIYESCIKRECGHEVFSSSFYYFHVPFDKGVSRYVQLRLYTTDSDGVRSRSTY